MTQETTQGPDGFAFTPENLARAREIIARYPAGKQASAVMPLLDLAQRQHGGWLPGAAMDYVAEFLEMPPVRVYEVATFYTMYNKRPVGAHHIKVCTNIACWLRGAEDLMAALRERRGLDNDETDRDGTYTLSEVECLGACVNAPVMQVNDDYYEDLDADSARAVVEALGRGEAPAPGSRTGRQGSAPEGGPTVLTGKGEG